MKNANDTMSLVKEENDEELQMNWTRSLKSLTKQLNEFELQLLLSEPYDKNNAILELHPGAGGTESQDWASMLFRMYTSWADDEDSRWKPLIIFLEMRRELKAVTLLIKGHNAYGYLKAEKGVHRLVRISPFDSSGRGIRRLCPVMSCLNSTKKSKLRSARKILKIDTYRASGAGGQHVNTTDSAVQDHPLADRYRRHLSDRALAN